MSSTKSADGHLELVKSGPIQKKPTQTPRVLQQIEDEALEASARLLEHLFSATDDLFYELSKRASSNNEENLYFESMRELRLKKGALAKGFNTGVKGAFQALFDQSKSTTATDTPEQNLALVEGDELEFELAYKGMSSRSQGAFQTELYEICVRLDHLLLQVDVSESNNPLDPSVFARVFVETAQENLKVDIKTQLIVFKLFEKHVLKQLGHIYAAVNQILIEAGILPKVPRAQRQNNSSKNNSQNPGASDTQNAAPVTSDSISEAQPLAGQINEPATLNKSTIATLMAAFRNSQGALYTAPASQGQNGNNYYFYASNPGPVMPAPDLTKNLTLKQSLVDKTLRDTAQPQNLLPSVIAELLSHKNPGEPQALEQPEEDTINLVAMFFDQVLEDKNLPVAVQSLICRLQIPVLKLALNNTAFLADSRHPARRLINTITQVGLSLDEGKPIEKDPIFKKLADSVQIINKQFKLDAEVFSSVQEELESLLERESKKSSIVEKRTTQTEEGKVKIRNARLLAQNTIYEKVKDIPLPSKINEFLTNTWQQVLIITFIRSGKDCAEWVENEQLISDLVWLSQPDKDERSLARAQRLRPDIFARIERGLAAAVDNEESRIKIINGIESSLNQLDGIEPANGEQPALLSEDQRQQLGKLQPQEKSWDDMTALERQQSKYEELSSKFFKIAKDMPIDTWLAYTDDLSGRTYRCKLSAKIEEETYVFVSRLGFKALEKTRRQFAYDMQFKKVQILDSSPLFDRIMNKISETLLSKKTNSPQN